jgi:hypothetical protein
MADLYARGRLSWFLGRSRSAGFSLLAEILSKELNGCIDALDFAVSSEARAARSLLAAYKPIPKDQDQPDIEKKGFHLADVCLFLPFLQSLVIKPPEEQQQNT